MQLALKPLEMFLVGRFPRRAKINLGMIDGFHRLLLRIAYRVLSWLPRLRRRRRQGVAVAVWDHDEVLVVRHSYRPGYFLPGGNAGRGESLLDAARRELREEVGIDAEPDALVPVYTTAWVRVFEYCPCHRPEVRIDNREIVEARFVRPPDLERPPEFLESYLLSRVG